MNDTFIKVKCKGVGIRNKFKYTGIFFMEVWFFRIIYGVKFLCDRIIAVVNRVDIFMEYFYRIVFSGYKIYTCILF